jgi:hypothetical protein
MIRSIVAMALRALAGVLLFFGGLFAVGASIVGSPASSANTFSATVSSREGSHAMAEILVGHFITALGPKAALLSSDRSVLIEDVASALRDPMVKSTIQSDFTKVYVAYVAGMPADLDIRPLLYGVATQAHKLNPAIPARPVLSPTGTTVRMVEPSTFRFLHYVSKFGWLALWLISIGSILSGLVALVLVKRREMKVASLVVGFGGPALGLWALGHYGGKWLVGSVGNGGDTQALARSAVSVIQSLFTHESILLGVIGAAVLTVVMVLSSAYKSRKAA